MTELCNNRESKKRRYVSRRDFLFDAGGGISGLALAYLLNQEGLLAAEPTTGAPASCLNSEGIMSPLTAKPSHFKPRAKSVISIFLSGGVSHVDTFDPKPMLEKHHGEPLTGFGEIKVRQGYPGPLMKSPYKFKEYGQNGITVSEIFPNIASIIDEFALIRSLTGKSSDHVLSHYEWNTGTILMGFPSVGSWVTYGLGSVNQNLPAFVVIYDRRGGPFSGPSNWSAGYLPAAFQGTVFRSSGDPILDLAPPSKYLTPEEEKMRLDHLTWLNQNHAEKNPGSTELAARIASYELAYRMQSCAPEAVDINKENDETKKLYGLDNEITEPFGKQALMARRLVERGVRFIQLYNGSIVNQNVDTWDAHESIVKNHGMHAPEVDLPIKGLILDLKRRGLLEDTLVLMHSEFGRMPISQRGVGRDHNPGAGFCLMAGAGIKGGQVIGATDDFGYQAAQQVITPHDLHASLLYLLGMDHKKLTFFFNGRNMRLTDVYGELIPQICDGLSQPPAKA